MNESLILQSALIGNILAVIGSLVVATKYYFASRELHQALRKQSEQDGLRYAQSFQTQLWQERKDTLERELAAYNKDYSFDERRLKAKEEREKKNAEYRERIDALGRAISASNIEKAKQAGITTDWQKVDLKSELPEIKDTNSSYYDDVQVRLEPDRNRFEGKIFGSSIIFSVPKDEENPRKYILSKINSHIAYERGVDDYYSRNPNENPGG